MTSGVAAQPTVGASGVGMGGIGPDEEIAPERRGTCRAAAVQRLVGQRPRAHAIAVVNIGGRLVLGARALRRRRRRRGRRAVRRVRRQRGRVKAHGVAVDIALCRVRRIVVPGRHGKGKGAIAPRIGRREHPVTKARLIPGRRKEKKEKRKKEETEMQTKYRFIKKKKVSCGSSSLPRGLAHQAWAGP